MDKKLIIENDILKAKAKALRDRGIKLKMRPGYSESLTLNKIIRTQEQADLFMKILRAL
jgi:hypothetical protein